MLDPEMFRLDEHVAVITGAGAGIGQSIAEVLADAGAAVVIDDLDRQAAEKVAANIVAAGGRAAGTACDVTREEDLEALIAFALGRSP